jgi:hypothetical protein
MITASVVASQFVDHDVSDATRRGIRRQLHDQFRKELSRSINGVQNANQMTVLPIGI